MFYKTIFVYRHPRSLNSQDRSNSAPNVCINNVLKPPSASDHKILQSIKPFQVNYNLLLILDTCYQILISFLDTIQSGTFSFNTSITYKYFEARQTPTC